MTILFLSRWIPDPPDNGSKIRIRNILEQLAKRHEVTLLAFNDSPNLSSTPAARALREYCSEVRILPYRAFRPSSLRACLGFFSTQPRSLVDTFSPEMCYAVRDECQRQTYDLIVASELAMVPYALTQQRIPALLEDLELTVFKDAIKRASSWRKRFRSLGTWVKLRAYLRTALPRFAVCTVPSDLERHNVCSAVPGYSSVEVVPNAVNLAHYDGHYQSPDSNTLIFAGSLTYEANYDAVRFFLRDIYPGVVRAIPNVTVQITGNNTGVDLSALPRYTGVRHVGHLPDVRAAIAQCWGSIVPLRIGSGTRLKILESMALGTPVISTSKGAEGLDVTNEENILLADRPEEFARRVVELLTSHDLRCRLAKAGRRLVETRYDWCIVGENLRALVERVQVEAKWMNGEWE